MSAFANAPYLMCRSAVAAWIRGLKARSHGRPFEVFVSTCAGRTGASPSVSLICAAGSGRRRRVQAWRGRVVGSIFPSCRGIGVWFGPAILPRDFVMFFRSLRNQNTKLIRETPFRSWAERLVIAYRRKFTSVYGWVNQGLLSGEVAGVMRRSDADRHRPWWDQNRGDRSR